AAAFLLWAVFTARIRAIARSVKARSEERADERVRIARELHDTLLQGIQGLLLTFHVASQKLAPEDDSRKILEKALSSADRLVIEGRNRVNSLRAEHLSDTELPGALKAAGEDLNSDGRVDFDVARVGKSTPLKAHVVDEILLVGRELLTNAFRHARAR